MKQNFVTTACISENQPLVNTSLVPFLMDWPARVCFGIAHCAPVAQLDRAPDYESGGQRFESFRARHQYLNKIRYLDFPFSGNLRAHVAFVLQLTFLDLQRFQLVRGYSTRHGTQHGLTPRPAGAKVHLAWGVNHVPHSNAIYAAFQHGRECGLSDGYDRGADTQCHRAARAYRSSCRGKRRSGLAVIL